MIRHRRGRLGRAVLVAVTVLAGASCGGGSAPTPIRIGLLTDTSGLFHDFGSDIRAAVEVAVDEVNAAGGINDARLEVLIEDTGSDPNEARIGLDDLEDSGVFAVVGPLSSREAAVVFPEAARLQVPILTGTVNEDGITDLGDSWAFRDTATNTQLYQAAMPVFQQRYGVSTVVVVFDDVQRFSTSAVEGPIPEQARAAGITIAFELPVHSGDTSFASVAQRIGDTPGLDGLIVVTGASQAAGLARELSRLPTPLPVLGHPAENSPEFRDAGESIHEWVVPSVVDPRAERVVALFEAMAARGAGEAVMESANYYDLVHAIAQVARSAGLRADTAPAEARRALRDGIAGLQGFAGAAGPITFEPSGDVQRAVFTLLLEGTNPPEVIG
jgi:branched-chain amino acid transport system substrate-binding protein